MSYNNRDDVMRTTEDLLKDMTHLDHMMNLRAGELVDACLGQITSNMRAIWITLEEDVLYLNFIIEKDRQLDREIVLEDIVTDWEAMLVDQVKFDWRIEVNTDDLDFTKVNYPCRMIYLRRESISDDAG